MERTEPCIFLVPVVNNQTCERALARVKSSTATGAQEAAVVHMFRTHGWHSITGCCPVDCAPLDPDAFAYGRLGGGLVLDLQAA